MSEPWLFLIDVAGWTLLHFVWQGLALAAALGLVLLVVPRRRAGLRYVLGCLTLALMAAAPVVTAWQLVRPQRVPAAAQAAAFSGTGPSAALDAVPSRGTERAAAFAGPVPGAVHQALPPLSWIVGAWLAGVFLASVRLAGGWWRAQRLLRVGASIPDPLWRDLVARLAPRVGLNAPVRVLESARIHVPMVIGCIRPALLLPASALTGLTPRQLEAVIAHELAHIARHDYLVNLLQSSVETLLFYHPAVWWVSHRVRVEREHCCDDLAVDACGDAILYARALTELEARRQGGVGFAMAASSGSLVSRVRRLVGAAPSPRLASSAWVVASLTALMVAGAGAIGWMQGVSRLVAETADAPFVQPSRAPAASPVLASAPAVAGDRSDGRAPGERSAELADAYEQAGAAAREDEDRRRQEKALLKQEKALRKQDAARLKQEKQRLEQENRHLQDRSRTGEELSERLEELTREIEVRTRDIEARAEELARHALESKEMRAATERMARDIERSVRDLMEGGLAKDLERLKDPELSARLSKEIELRGEKIGRRAQVMAEQAIQSIDWAQIEKILEEMRTLEDSLRRLLDERRDAGEPPAAAKPSGTPPPAAPDPSPQPKPGPRPEVRRHQPSVAAPPAPPAPAAAPVPPPPPASVSPVPAVPPVPPVPPPAPPDGVIDFSRSDASWMSTWTTNGERTTVKGKGRIELTGDDGDVRRLSPGGWFIVERSDGLRSWIPWGDAATRFEARAGADGAIARTYVVDGRKLGPDEGRKWLRTFLPPLVRNMGFAAEARVERILKQAGPEGVLREIAQVNNDPVRRTYFTHFFRQAALPSPMLARALAQAGQTMRSDYELAGVLVAAAERFALDGMSAAAYARGARRVTSDYEQRRALTPALRQTGLTRDSAGPLTRAAMPDGSAGIDSDYEMAELLLAVPASSIEAAPQAYFDAARTIGSPYERRRVLSAHAARRGLSEARIATLARLAGEIASDFERAEVLLALAAYQRLSGTGREAVLAAARGIGSDYDRGRVLSAMLETGALASADR